MGGVLQGVRCSATGKGVVRLAREEYDERRVTVSAATAGENRNISHQLDRDLLTKYSLF